MRACLITIICVLFLLPLPAAFSQALDDYTIFSNDYLVLRDRVKIKNGLIGSNTGLQLGYDDVLTGNVKSKGSMVMYDRALVAGNVTLGGTLSVRSGARVTGTITVNTTVPVIANPAESYYTSMGDVTLGAGETRHLIPAAYGNVDVPANATLALRAGDYYFSNLNLQADATLLCAAAGVHCNVWVSGELKIGARARLILGPGLLDPTGVRIYSHQTASLAIGTDARIEAVLTLPRAAVTVGDRTVLTGKLRAKAVAIGYDVPVNDATLADGDADGMPDGWEIARGLNPKVNDAAADPDGDGLKNVDEFGVGTNPKVADTDGDGIKDGAEYDFWGDYGWNITATSDPDYDGLPNILDPDSDNDGMLDGTELAGWSLTVQGVTKNYVGDPGKPDSDYDGVTDNHERDGYATDFPNHTIHLAALNPSNGDEDMDGIETDSEIARGLNPKDPQTIGSMTDKKYFDMVNHMGEWAVSPTTGHLNPQLPSTSACILGVNMGFGDDTTTALSVDRQVEMCVYLPQDGQPITLKLDFIYDSSATPDPADKFYGITYSGAVYPGGTDGAPAIAYTGAESNSITWRIADPLYGQKGDYFFNFSYHYDKNNGEKPRQIRMYASYDDNTRVRIEYLSPVKAGTYRSPLHFNLLVTGGNQPAYFRGETAVTGDFLSGIDNVKVTDYYGNLTRNIGRKAFNGYWFQYPLGKLTSYPGGVSGTTGCNRLEFDWVHDAAADKNRVIFAIDEVGNKWDDVQITYDAAYKTQDYYCWYGGVGRNTAVLRRGTAFRAAATNAGLQTADAQVKITNRGGTDVTSKFTIHKESGYEDYAAYDGANAAWRENWIVESSANTPAGMYTITMKNGSAWSASASFYLILGSAETSMSQALFDDQCYDEDTDGLALDGDTDLAGDLLDIFDIGGDDHHHVDMDLCAKTVTDFAVAAVDGKTTPFAVRDALRLAVGKMVFGSWPSRGRQRDYTNGGTPLLMLAHAGMTVAEVLSGTVPDAHMFVGDCTDFARLSVGLSRSIGVPSRMVTNKGCAFRPKAEPDSDGVYRPSAETWPHVWSEAWIENPPNGTDKWYVFDATDYVWSINGFSASRKQYGSIWIDFSGTTTIFTCKPSEDVVPYYKP